MRILILDDARQWQRLLGSDLSDIADSVDVDMNGNADLFNRAKYSVVVAEPFPVDLFKEGFNIRKIAQDRADCVDYAKKHKIPLVVVTSADYGKSMDAFGLPKTFPAYLRKPLDVPKFRYILDAKINGKEL